MRTILKTNFVEFMTGLTLFLVSLILLSIMFPVSIVYNFVYHLVTLRFQQGLNKIGSYMYKLALSIDQFGNVLCGDLFQVLFTKKGGHPFGDEDDTISYVLARNKYKGKLTWLGRIMVSILNFIEKDHIDIAIENKKGRDQEALLRINQDEYYE